MSTVRMKPYVLRDYQREAVNDGLEYFAEKQPRGGGLMVLPTGSGKSLVIAGVARALDQPTLVFQPTKEILEQNFAKLRAYGEPAGIYSASLGRKEIERLTLATIGSVKNAPELFHSFRNFIIDECHLVNAKGGMYRDFLRAVDTKRVLGLTATPYRLVTDGFGGSILKFLTRTRPRIFNRVIHITQNSTLFERGYLAQLKYRSIDGFDSRQLRLNSTGADFDDRSVKHYYKHSGFSDRLFGTVEKALDVGRRNILIFTRFIEESQELAERLGDDCEIVTGETPRKERESILGRFRRGEIPVVTNVGVLTVGFDFPQLETVILARPTMSLALYYQMIGRCVRTDPTKEEAWVLDLCDNFSKFGRVEHLRLVAPRPELWHIESQGRQLTNIYYGDKEDGRRNTRPEPARQPFWRGRSRRADS